MNSRDWIIDGPADAGWTLILAHGAGQDMNSPVLDHIARWVSGQGIRVVRVRFPFMALMPREQRRRPPDPIPRLMESWRSVIRDWIAEGLCPSRLVIGGKSLGGRVASLIADDCNVGGLAVMAQWVGSVHSDCV